MYQKPALERFGTFRDLTLEGCNSGTDGATKVGAIAGANPPRFIIVSPTSTSVEFCYGIGISGM